MARSRTKRPIQIALALAAVAAAGAALYLTKPGGPSTSAPGEGTPPAENHAPPIPAATQRAAESKGAEAPVAQKDAAAGVGEQHGPDAVVRAGEASEAAGAVALPLGTPNWNAPVELGFSDFKALRRRYREAKAFSIEDVARLHGAAVVVRGALMPIDPIPKSGEMRRFWLANPVVVMAGCVFCFPPTLADLVYVTTEGAPFVVDRERLYRSVEFAKLLGRFELGPGASDDGVSYMFSMKLKERLE